MEYIRLAPYIHLFLEPKDRQKVELEAILTAGGSWFEAQSDRGKKHLMEHCVASRTHQFDYQQLKDYSFRENIYLNAYTGALSMGFETNGHQSDFKKLVDLLLEITFSPVFDDTDLNREKEIVLREISERRGDPNYRLHFDIQKHIFQAKSIENHQTLGDPRYVAQTKLNDFQELYRQNMSGSHILICVSGGGIDLNYLTEQINQYLSSTQNPYVSELLKNTNTSKQISMDIQ